MPIGDGQQLESAAHAAVPTSPAGQRGLLPVRLVLPNGLTVLAKETRTTPAVTISVALRAGSVCDPTNCHGLAHFVSRVVDRGTASRSADQIAGELDERGVSLSVAVNRHVVRLVCTCLAEDFSVVLSLIGDIVMHPTFPAVEVETRRGEIVTLLLQDQDNPATVAMEALMHVLYGDGHPYGWRIRGTINGVERMIRRELVDFHARRFFPHVTSVVLVGDVDPDRAADITESVFGGWRASGSPEPVFPDVPPSRVRRVDVVPMMNKAQADIAYGFTAIRRADPRYHAYSLLNNILGQYALGGRLGDSIRERQGMAYYSFSSLDASIAPGPLIVRAGVSPANVERAVVSIDAELRQMAAEGPTDRELADSKQYLIGSMPRTLETNAGIATFLQTAELFGLGLDYDRRLPSLIGAVTRDAVHEAARDILDPSRAAVVVAGPYTGALQ